MADFTVGEWHVSVSEGGHPAWVTIERDGDRIGGIHHKHLADLKYAIEKAMRAARRSLGEPYAGEVDG